MLSFLPHQALVKFRVSGISCLVLLDRIACMYIHNTTMKQLKTEIVSPTIHSTPNEMIFHRQPQMG